MASLVGSVIGSLPKGSGSLSLPPLDSYRLTAALVGGRIAELIFFALL